MKKDNWPYRQTVTVAGTIAQHKYNIKHAEKFGWELYKVIWKDGWYFALLKIHIMYD